MTIIKTNNIFDQKSLRVVSKMVGEIKENLFEYEFRDLEVDQVPMRSRFSSSLVIPQVDSLSFGLFSDKLNYIGG